MASLGNVVLLCYMWRLNAKLQDVSGDVDGYDAETYPEKTKTRLFKRRNYGVCSRGSPQLLRLFQMFSEETAVGRSRRRPGSDIAFRYV